MATDLMKFWSPEMIGASDRVHPADQQVIGRIKHPFDLKCLPCPYTGRLCDAPVVLLYLSPGWNETHRKLAKSKAFQDDYVKRRSGESDLPGGDQAGTSKWFASRATAFGEFHQIKSKLAFLNIGAYHSESVDSLAVLASLPSSRASIEWAQTVLFPAAEAGERVVVCLRSPALWGLEKGKRYGKALFAPRAVRSGRMIKDAMQETIKKLAARAMGIA